MVERTLQAASTALHARRRPGAPQLSAQQRLAAYKRRSGASEDTHVAVPVQQLLLQDLAQNKAKCESVLGTSVCRAAAWRCWSHPLPPPAHPLTHDCSGASRGAGGPAPQSHHSAPLLRAGHLPYAPPACPRVQRRNAAHTTAPLLHAAARAELNHGGAGRTGDANALEEDMLLDDLALLAVSKEAVRDAMSREALAQQQRWVRATAGARGSAWLTIEGGAWPAGRGPSRWRRGSCASITAACETFQGAATCSCWCCACKSASGDAWPR